MSLRLWLGLGAGILLAGYVGALNINLARERAALARLDADLSSALAQVDICTGNLSDAIRDKLTDEVADNLTASELRNALRMWIDPDL